MSACNVYTYIFIYHTNSCMWATQPPWKERIMSAEKESGVSPSDQSQELQNGCSGLVKWCSNPQKNIKQLQRITDFQYFRLRCCMILHDFTSFFGGMCYKFHAFCETDPQFKLSRCTRASHVRRYIAWIK